MRRNFITSKLTWPKPSKLWLNCKIGLSKSVNGCVDFCFLEHGNCRCNTCSLVQGDGRGGFRTSAGDISSVVPLGLGEPLAPYATVDFTVALNEQTTKKERPPVGVTIPKPEPDMELEEDAQAGLSVVAMGTTAADDLGVCRLEYEASRFHD